MGSMFSGNRMSKEEMEVVVNKAKEIVSAYPVVVLRFVLVEISHLGFTLSFVIMMNLLKTSVEGF